MTKKEQYNTWGFYIIKQVVESDYVSATAFTLFHDVYVTKSYKRKKTKSPLLAQAEYQAEARFKSFILSNLEN